MQKMIFTKILNNIFCSSRAFQKIWCDLQAKPEDQNLRELAKFAKFVVQKFLAVAATNKKVFMELLFWKTARGTAGRLSVT
jgi:hypothetical protein